MCGNRLKGVQPPYSANKINGGIKCPVKVFAKVLSSPKNILNLIGNTPIVKLKFGSISVFAKMEFLNPSGSIKDRIAKEIIEAAEKSIRIKNGIIEPTSGNTGISLAFISALKGYRFIAVMPEFVSKERKAIIEHYGGKVIITPEKLGMTGAVEKAKTLARKNNLFMPNQFENKYNIIAHEKTGLEIKKQIKADVFVAGVGTGGTLIGIARVLKPNGTKIVAVEPKTSPLISKGKPGKHKIEGIGEDFIPEIIKKNVSLIDEVVTVSDWQAIKMAKKLGEMGFFVGISSGANVFAAIKIAKKLRNKNIVTILPDSADRYYSTKLFGKGK